MQTGKEEFILMGILILMNTKYIINTRLYYIMALKKNLKSFFVSGCDIKKATKIAKATLPIKAIKRHLIAARMQTHLTIEEINTIIDALISYKRE